MKFASLSSTVISPIVYCTVSPMCVMTSPRPVLCLHLYCPPFLKYLTFFSSITSLEAGCPFFTEIFLQKMVSYNICECQSIRNDSGAADFCVERCVLWNQDWLAGQSLGWR